MKIGSKWSEIFAKRIIFSLIMDISDSGAGAGTGTGTGKKI